MNRTLSREEELKNDLENLFFTKKYLIGVLAELEELGLKHSQNYKDTEQNLFILNNNIRRIQEEIEKEEEKWINDELDKLDAEDIISLW